MELELVLYFYYVYFLILVNTFYFHKVFMQIQTS